MDLVPSFVLYQNACELREKLTSPSQSHLRAMVVWVYITFTSVLNVFLLGVLKQPAWPHFKEEKAGTYSKASLYKEVAQGDDLPMSKLPVCLK